MILFMISLPLILNWIILLNSVELNWFWTGIIENSTLSSYFYIGQSDLELSENWLRKMANLKRVLLKDF